MKFKSDAKQQNTPATDVLRKIEYIKEGAKKHQIVKEI